MTAADLAGAPRYTSRDLEQCIALSRAAEARLRLARALQALRDAEYALAAEPRSLYWLGQRDQAHGVVHSARRRVKRCEAVADLVRARRG